MKSHKNAVLDTNAAIAALAGDRALLHLLADVEVWSLPTIVLGELAYGAYASIRVRENLRRISSFASLCSILAIDEDTSQSYGRVRTELRFAGRPLPSNDVWIASLCRQNDLPLISRDRHFDSVESLVVIDW